MMLTLKNIKLLIKQQASMTVQFDGCQNGGSEKRRKTLTSNCEKLNKFSDLAKIELSNYSPY